MSQENLDLVMAGVQAALARPTPDYETVNRAYAPDHVLIPLGAGVLLEEAHGAAGFRGWLTDTGDLLDAEHEMRGAVDLGPDKVLVVTTTRFKGAVSGVSAEQRSWAVVTVKDGKIARTELFANEADALEAVGLRE
jgi:ketosteroid isomerase-like protein